MNNDLETFINTLKEYEQELIDLWKEFNPQDSCLKMELLAMKMNIIYYKYTIECLGLVNDAYKEQYLFLLKKLLTFVSYGLSGLAFFKAPEIAVPSVLGSLYLTLKTKKYNRLNRFLTEDETDEILDLLDSFENEYSKNIDCIFAQIDVFEDDNIINCFNEPERSKRMACKKLMQFLRSENPNLVFEDEAFNNNIKDIINDSFNTNSDNLGDLIEAAESKYQSLNNNLSKLDKKETRLSRVFQIIG